MRYSKKNAKGAYIVPVHQITPVTEGVAGEAIERLGRYENVYDALTMCLEESEQNLSRLRSQGKVKSVTFQQLLGKKIQYEAMLQLFFIHGIEPDAKEAESATPS